jgi:DNA-binding NarL/FixJ family response regulator
MKEWSVMRKHMEMNRVKSYPLMEAGIAWVLIVEDDTDFRQLIREVLINHFPSLNIEEAANKRQALQKIKQFSPQLIFMDTNMLDGSSLPLVTEIKKTHPETVIVALTLYNIKEYKDAALQSGADFFLAKSSLTGNIIVELVASVISAFTK